MGVPVKITLRGQTVFLCCKGCVGEAKRSPDEMLKKIADAAAANHGEPFPSQEPTTSPTGGR